MIDITPFNEDHRNILNITQQLAATLNAKALARDAWDTRGLLSVLAGKLKVHLALEDRILYPALQSSPNENVRSLSQQFSDEMGGIAKVFQSYMDKWPHAMAIEERPQEFVDDTQGILEVLGKRIEKEENVLYPMASDTSEHPNASSPGASNSVHAT